MAQATSITNVAAAPSGQLPGKGRISTRRLPGQGLLVIPNRRASRIIRELKELAADLND